MGDGGVRVRSGVWLKFRGPWRLGHVRPRVVPSFPEQRTELAHELTVSERLLQERGAAGFEEIGGKGVSGEARPEKDREIGAVTAELVKHVEPALLP